MSYAGLIRVPYMVFPTEEAALEAGFPAAEAGVWQRRPGLPDLVPGWIALDWQTREGGAQNLAEPYR